MTRRWPNVGIITYVTDRRARPLDDEFKRLSVRLVHGPGDLLGLLHFWWTCLRSEATVAHSNAHIVSAFYCLAAALPGIKIRIAHYSTASFAQRSVYGAVLRRLERALLPLGSTQMIGVSEAARHVAAVGTNCWPTIYDGVSRSKRDGAVARAGVPRLLLLGRLHPEKGYLKAVDLFDTLRSAAASPCTLTRAGVGSPDNVLRLRWRVEASLFEDWITIADATRSPRLLLRPADALLLPLAREGLASTVFEALAEGAPAVATDLPALREIGRHTGASLLIGQYKDHRRWAETIAEALKPGPSDGIKEQFERSPFQLRAHVESVALLWRLGRSERVHDS